MFLCRKQYQYLKACGYLCSGPLKLFLFDPAFNNSEFTKYLDDHGIECRPLPPRRHNKNAIESKHKIIRDIYLRLKGNQAEHSAVNEQLLVQQAMRVSNDLYGNDVFSAHELAKGYTRPVTQDSYPAIVPDGIIQARNDLVAKRKLTKTLKSRAITEHGLMVADLVQVFIKKQIDKRGKRSTSNPILSFHRPSGTVSVPGKRGHVIKAAIEDVRPALKSDTLACAIQDTIDHMDSNLDKIINDVYRAEDDNVNDPNPVDSNLEDHAPN